ncbi:MAG TPA: glycosyltransferase family A protein, partial [Candidatus Binataceae bacterium]|nr:glycosyltransferase family A protein [Candidatus Binataceae bacterium]
MPRVSVIIPVFNAAKTVGQAIDSVLAQTMRDFEIVAVDDGSRDASLAILKNYGDKLRILEQQNRGPSAARNLGIANSSGEYLGFLDADDWWQPEFLARMLPPLERDAGCVLAYCDLQLADSRGT